MIREDHRERFWALIKRAGPNECWEWQGKVAPNGYGYLSYYGRQYAHRVAWSLSNGSQIPKLCILHSCDNRKCCNPAHLREGTARDNMRDKVERGRSSFGSRNGRAVLTESDVFLIRQRYVSGAREVDLAADFNVAQTTISAIVRGETWKEVRHGAA